LYIVPVAVPVFPKPAQMDTRQETLASIKTVGTIIRHGEINQSAQPRRKDMPALSAVI